MILRKKILIVILLPMIAFASELVREEIYFRRSAAYRLENAVQQSKPKMKKEQVIQFLGDTELKVSDPDHDFFDVWTWKKTSYQRRLWNLLGAKPRRDPLEITAFFTEEGLSYVMIENIDYHP